MAYLIEYFQCDFFAGKNIFQKQINYLKNLMNNNINPGPFYFVSGPPQSGKSEKIAEIIKDHIHKQHVLFVESEMTPGASRFSQELVEETKVLRVHSMSDVLNKVLPFEADPHMVTLKVQGVPRSYSGHSVVVINNIDNFRHSEKVLKVIRDLCSSGLTVVAAGVSFDKSGQLHETSGQCALIATKHFSTNECVPFSPDVEFIPQEKDNAAFVDVQTGVGNLALV